MEVYFIRHGQTAYNKRRVHQHPKVYLSQEGRREAHVAGKCLSVLNSSPVLLSSDFLRAKGTAEIIGKEIGSVVHEEELFREMRRPSMLAGHSFFSFLSLGVVFMIIFNAWRPKWHYKDEENLYDVNMRVYRALEFLQQLAQKQEQVVVVSHAVFITLLIAYIRNGKISFFSYILSMAKLRRVKNASITRLSYSEGASGTNKWKIRTVNDVGHFRDA